MSIITSENGFIHADFTLEPLARPNLASRYAVWDRGDDQQKLEVLAQKRRAHVVAQFAIGLNIEWHLIFDVENSGYLIFEFLEDQSLISSLISLLDGRKFERAEIPREAIEVRPRQL